MLGLPDLGFGLLLTATAVGATIGGLLYPLLNNRALEIATDK